MSKTIDQRVVEMGFDNANFERNAQGSIRTLDALKKSLNLEEAVKGLGNLSNAGKTFSLAGIAEGVEAISNRFSTMGIIGMTVIQNLTNSAVDAAKKIFDSLVLNPAKMGFSEYETQINAIQTVLANTASKGTTLSQVNDALDELNEYSDKTIYNFTEMTKNIGTFTAAGVDLDTATNAIKGIANLAAVSGSTSQQASTAMYQLSQALASGTVKLMDWNSVVNAGMGGQVFQDALKETARAHGIAIDDMIKKEGSFRDTLQKGWLTSGILTETLSKFTGDLTAEQLKTMGYTEEQIAGIIELGKMASDSATKVKTFSQLWSTAAEALQSGWGQSWRLIVGDFEEARTTFTQVADAIGSMIKTSSEGRNKALEHWRFFGGREQLIAGFQNSFKALMSVVKPLGEAFQEVFPIHWGYLLLQITAGFKNLSKALILNDENGAKVKRIFMGLFSIFKIVTDGLKLLAKFLFSLAEASPLSGSAILDFLANIGDFLVGIKDSFSTMENFKKTMATIGEFVKKMADKARLGFLGLVQSFSSIEAIKTVFANIKTTLGMFWTSISGFIKNIQGKLPPLQLNFMDVFGKIRDFLVPIGDRIKEVFGSIQSSLSGLELPKIDTGKTFGFLGDMLKNFHPLEKLGDILPPIIDAIKEKFVEFTPVLKNLAGSAKQGLGNLGKIIGEAFQKIDWDTVFQGITTGAFVAMFLEIKKAFKSGGGILSSVKGMFDGVSETLTSVQESLKVWQNSLKADVIMKIAIAVGILALALLGLSLIDGEKLAVALISMGVLFKGLMDTLKTFDQIASNGNAAKMGAIALGLLGISVAVLILSYALEKISKLDSKALIKGVGAVALLAVILTKSAKSLSENAADLRKSATSLILFGLGMLVLAGAVYILSTIDGQKLVNGLLGMAGILVAVGAFSKATDDLKGIDKGKALGLVILGAALIAMSFAVKMMGELDPEKLMQGLLVMGAVLLELAVFLRLAGDPKNMIATSIGLTILAGALYLLQYPILALAAIPQEAMAEGLKRMGMALAILAIAMNVLPKDTGVKAVGIALVAGSLYLLSQVLGILGQMPIDQLAIGMGSMAVMLGVMAVALNAMQTAIPGATALAIATVALLGFAVVMKILGSMSWEQIGIGLAAIAGFLLVMGIAGALVGPVVPVLLAFSAAILMIGAAAAAIGVGIMLFSIGLAGLVATLYALGPIIPILAENFTKAVKAFSTAFVDAAPDMLKAFVAMLMILIDGFNIVMPALIDAVFGLVFGLIAGLYTALAEKMPEIVEAGYSIILSLMKGFRDHIGEIVETGIEIVVEIIRAYQAKLPLFIDAGWKFVIALIDGWTASVDANLPQLMTSISALGGAIIAGLIEGVIGGIAAFGGAFKDLIEGGLQVFKELLGIQSPSTVFAGFGDNIVQGLIDGVIAKVPAFLTALRDMATKAIRVIREKIQAFVQAGRALIGGLISGIGERIGAVVAKVSEIMTSIGTEIAGWKDRLIIAGKNIVQGLIDGMDEMIDLIVDKAGEIVNAILRIIGKVAKIESPSKVTTQYGRYIAMGLSIGMDQYASRAVGSAEQLVKDTISAMSSTISRISDLVNENLNTNPIITPVFDLSEIISGAEEINNMLGKKSLALATSRNLTSMATRIGTPINETEKNSGKETSSVNFYQNNYSPEPLSRIEIYRQTRNQLNLLKGLARA